MKHATWFAPAALFAGLASAPSLAHGGATVAVGLPPVVVDVGDVHMVIGAPPPPPVVVQQPLPPPVVVVHEHAPPPRYVVVREVPRSTVVVYPRHRQVPPMVREVVVVKEHDRCDHPGKHKGHHKHKGHGKHEGKDGHGHDHGRGGDRHDDDGGYWR